MATELMILIVCAGLQLCYYLFFFARLNFVRGYNGVPSHLPPASIIICAKNEAKNLAQNLKVVMIQQYPQFEVIVVNDQSTDNTLDVLIDYYRRNPTMKLVNIPPDAKKEYAGKKHALLKGIEVATFDHIVVTDADCRPQTTYWLAKLVGAYMSDTKVVLGHSPYEKGKGFLNSLIRYENYMTALQYFGFAKAGIPYMGVGRNMSYKKEVLQGFKGFDTNKDMATGDDDLLINAVANGRNTEVCIDKDAFMVTKPATTFGDWLNQKRRHMRSGFKYKFHHQLLLLVFALSNLLFYSTFLFLLIQAVHWQLAVAVFCITLLLKWLLTARVFNKLGVADLKWTQPVLDVLYVNYLVVIFFLLLLKPKDNWRT